MNSTTDNCAKSNIRVRTNVVSLATFLDDVTSFQKSLSWEELHQYLQLFWVNRTSEVIENLTEAQRAEKILFSDLQWQLPDSYRAVCNSHRFLLLPPGGQAEESPLRELIKDREVDQPSEVIRAETFLINPQDQVISAPMTARQLVLAPPGTGKTHTVVQRLAHLAASAELQGDLTPVLMVTFSRAASAELTQRLALEVTRRSGSIYQMPRISTLDSFSGTLLGQLVPGWNANGYDASIRWLARILDGEDGDELRERATELIRQRVRLVVVDEVQDVVGVRARLVRTLLNSLRGTDHGVLLLGDLRQAIFGFSLKRAPSNEQALDPFWLIRQVTGLYSDLERIAFTEQHRFSPSAQRLMTQLQVAMDDPAGQLLPGEQPNEGLLRDVLMSLPCLDDPLQLAGDDCRDSRVAILARTNDEVGRLEIACSEVLQRFGRTVRVVGSAEGRGYPGWVGRVLSDPGAPVRYTAEGFIQAYKRRVSGDRQDAEQALDWLVTACGLNRNAIDRAQVIETLRRNPDVPSDLRQQPRSGEVWISTIHQAKGREFDSVVITDVGRLLSSGAKDAEACRLAYVAATRARREVFRCGGSVWLPQAFEWMPIHFARVPAPAAGVGGCQTWHRSQEDLWGAYRSVGRLRIRHAGNELFVLELEAFGGVILYLSDEFTRDFLPHATRVLNVNSPVTSEYSVRIMDLRTYVNGNDLEPVILLPVLSGQIKRNN